MDLLAGITRLLWGLMKFGYQIPLTFFPEPKDYFENRVTSHLSSHLAKVEAGRVPTILSAMECGQLTAKQCTHIIDARYQVAHFFAGLLARAHRRLYWLFLDYQKHEPIFQLGQPWATSMVSIMHEVGGNLDEELGVVGYTGTKGEPHSQHRRQLLEALGFDYDYWLIEHRLPQCVDQKNFKEVLDQSAIHPAARTLLQRYIYLTDSSDPFIFAGAILEYEWRISYVDYPRLIAGLEKTFVHHSPFSQSPITSRHPLFHLISHAEHDKLHYQSLLKALRCAVKSRRNVKAVLNGIEIARYAWEQEFWETLGQDVLNNV